MVVEFDKNLRVLSKRKSDWTKDNALKNPINQYAVVVELVDTHGSGSCVLTDVGVRVSPTAPDLSFLGTVEIFPVIPLRPSFKGPDSSVGRATD